MFVLAIRVAVRGKGEASWKVVISGDRRTVSDEQDFLASKSNILSKLYGKFWKIIKTVGNNIEVHLKHIKISKSITRGKTAHP